MAVRTLNGLALCAGAGGLELGVSLACDHLGWDYRMVGAVERDAYAAACLVARMEDAALDRAPVWDDLATFDGAAWRGTVDLVTAGFPCQPFSQAGKRLGRDDERWLWPLVERVVRDVRPGLVFVENVPGLVAHGLGDVLGGLAALGFDAEWELLSAAEVGAPHKRERFWLLAYTDVGGCGAGVGDDGARQRDTAGRVADVADRDVDGCTLERREPRHDRNAWGDADGPGGEDVADADCCGGRARERPDAGPWTRAEPVGCRVWPPPPDDTDGWRAFIEADGPEPSVRRDADGLASRLDRLHTIGNGVVPLVAAAAFVRLARRAGLC